jgi:superfamily II DNA or RNA helicase
LKPIKPTLWVQQQGFKMSSDKLRRWQREAFAKWQRQENRGILDAATGGGKTHFALYCIEFYQKIRPQASILIAVPSKGLLDQWIEEVVSYFGCKQTHINICSKKRPIRENRINIGIFNTLAKSKFYFKEKFFLIVDECHKLPTASFSKILLLKTDASLGMSATPQRKYDKLFEKVLVPRLGKVFYRYSLLDGTKDNILVPFELNNIFFQPNPEQEDEIRKRNKKIAILLSKKNREDYQEEIVKLLILRAKLVNTFYQRCIIAIKTVLKNKNKKTIIFHEDIRSCRYIHLELRKRGVEAEIYHSQMKPIQRGEALNKIKTDQAKVLICCKALDEGLNIPSIDTAIIAASTATERQRIQRIGRVLRKSPGKKKATINTIFCTEPELIRLQNEVKELPKSIKVVWLKE